MRFKKHLVAIASLALSFSSVHATNQISIDFSHIDDATCEIYCLANLENGIYHPAQEHIDFFDFNTELSNDTLEQFILSIDATQLKNPITLTSKDIPFELEDGIYYVHYVNNDHSIFISDSILTLPLDETDVNIHPKYVRGARAPSTGDVVNPYLYITLIFISVFGIILLKKRKV